MADLEMKTTPSEFLRKTIYSDLDKALIEVCLSPTNFLLKQHLS